MKPLAALLLCAAFCHAAPKPNVLFIAIDDLRPELGCYGSKVAITPHIDRLAESAFVFDSAHVQVAVCNPSRASLFTGKRPDTIRVWHLRPHFRDLNPDIVTLPQHFKTNGYTSIGVGKIFHNPLPDRRSWSQKQDWEERGKVVGQAPDSKPARRKVVERMKAEGRPEAAITRLRGLSTGILDEPDERTVDGSLVTVAIRRLEELAKNDAPFFLAVGFIRPHLAFVAPRKYWDLYQREKLPLAPNNFLPKNSPPYAINTMYELRDYCDFLGSDAPPDGALPEADQRRLLHGYLACVSHIDAQVGRLMEALEKSGTADNTIIVLWGDHGWKLGEHRSWCKQTNYEIDTRVPMMIRAPGIKPARSDRPVECLDLYPTLSALAGLPVPDDLDGTSLAPLLRGETPEGKGAAVSQFERRYEFGTVMGYALRTPDHRYVEWRDKQTGKTVARELYDHSADPQENDNIAPDEESAKLVKKLSNQLRKTCPPRKMPPGCALRSPNSPTLCKLTVVNHLDQPATIHWIDTMGSRRHQTSVPAGKRHTINSRLGHVFAIESDDGQHFQLATASYPTSTVQIGGK